MSVDGDAVTHQPSWSTGRGPFLIHWIRATFLGWMLGFVLVLILAGAIDLVGVGDLQLPVGLGMGLGVGMMQARLIGQHVPRRGRWLAASAAGMAAPFVAVDVANVLAIPLPFSLTICVVLGGLAVGLLQWRLLRHIWRRAGWWVVASTAGWALAALTVEFNDRFLPRIPGVAGALLFVAMILLGGFALGATGGAALRSIMRTARSSA